MRKTPIALSVATALGSTAVGAAQIPVVLTWVAQDTFKGTAQGYLTGDTATWQYDTVAQRVLQTGGTHQANYFVGTTTLFSHFFTDFQIGSGLDAAATFFACVEGSFGNDVNASICGNYNFGSGNNNESTTTWGPGTAFARTMGGDDVSLGPQQSLSQYDGMTTSFNGSTVVVRNGYLTTGTFGYIYEFQVIPIPPAVWLFGSALGVLGWLRRRNR